MLTLISLLALAAPAPGALPPPPLERPAHAEGWQELVDGYQAAYDAWKQQIADSEDREERSKLRKEPPAIAWWPRFEQAGKAGEGRALLWMASHVRDKRVDRAEATRVKERMYAALAEHYAASPWYGEVLEELPGDAKYLSAETFTQVCDAGMEKSESADVRAAAMFTLGSYLRGSDDEAQQAAGLKWLEQVQGEYAGTRWATAALAATIRPEDLEPGKPAPDFAAATIDGHEFKLSDYRGKVVLLDFYGFW